MILNRIALAVMAVFYLYGCASIDHETSLQNAGAHFKIGVAYMNDGRIQQAFVEFQKAHELNPQDKEVLNAIGIIYMLHFDDTLKGIEYFEKAARVDPLYSEAYNNIGYGYERLGKYETAITYYKKALSNLLYPTADKAYINMGNAYYRMGKHDQAIAAFKEAARRTPSLSLPYFRMSLCYNALGRYGEAAAAITNGVLLDPLYKGDKDRALEDLSQKKLRATGLDEKDMNDYIEILKY